MALILANIPAWWLDIPGLQRTEDIAAVRDAIKRAGISKNDRINVEKVWMQMRGIPVKKKELEV